MRSASSALIALLNSSQQLIVCDCFTLTLITGTVLRYTTRDVPVTYNGNVFLASGPLIERSRTRTVMGLEVDTMDLTLTPNATDMIGSQTLIQAVASGAFDGGTVKQERVFFDASGAVVGGYVGFVGDLADVELDRFEVKVVANSKVHLLNVMLPRNRYQPGCMHTLFDAGCGLNRASFAVAGTVSAGATRFVVPSGLAQASGYFDQGYMEFTSGPLTGLKRTVKSQVAGVVTPLSPMPLAPVTGNTFTIFPGCDKLQATCSGKFANLPQFRGFPYIPQPETAR